MRGYFRPDPNASTALDAGETTSSVAIAGKGPGGRLTNAGPADAYVAFGGSGVTADTSEMLVLAGQTIPVVPGGSYMAAITAGGHARVSLTMGKEE